MHLIAHLHLDSVAKALRHEAKELVSFRPSDRPWQLPLAVAVAAGLPLCLGAMFERMTEASLASIGAMTILYLPRFRLGLRMIAIMASAFAMIACHALGQLGHFLPAVHIPILALITLLVTACCRFYRVGPPGALFFVMAAAIGVYAPVSIADAPANLGLFALGSLIAVIVAFVYSAHILMRRQPLPVPPPPEDLVEEVLLPAVIVGVFVGLSLAAAELVSLKKPYWAAVSCLAIIQSANLRAVWSRQTQRILGTFIGLGLTGALLSFVDHGWGLTLTIILLTFCVETAIVRHYAFAAIFITPLSILLAEASLKPNSNGLPLLSARFADTLIGCLFGALGGVCVHSPWLRRALRSFFQSAKGPSRKH